LHRTVTLPDVAAVLISPGDLDSLEETLGLLGDHHAVRALRTSPGS
jgi:PHD/YefM family antitoxin component YafN of YafNO toxin-antitoxin module